jgi:thiamine transporter ThiT
MGYLSNPKLFILHELHHVKLVKQWHLLQVSVFPSPYFQQKRNGDALNAHALLASSSTSAKCCRQVDLTIISLSSTVVGFLWHVFCGVFFFGVDVTTGLRIRDAGHLVLDKK